MMGSSGLAFRGELGERMRIGLNRIRSGRGVGLVEWLVGQDWIGWILKDRPHPEYTACVPKRRRRYSTGEVGNTS